MEKIKRSQLRSFLNTNTPASPTWSLIGAGVASAKIVYSPKVESVTHIHEDNASVSVEGYGPTMPVEATANNGDAVFEFLDALRKGRSTLDDAETEVVNVYLYETPALTYYVAEKQAVTISCDDFGGDGGAGAKINYTLNYVGDPTPGSFSPTDLAFVADPVLAVLDTMVIGSVTLTPLFATNKSWLWYAGSVANGVTEVQMDSTCIAAGAVVVQYDEAAPVLQGGDASLAVGVNHLSIEVTVGAEVVTYYIDITRAAA